MLREEAQRLVSNSMKIYRHMKKVGYREHLAARMTDEYYMLKVILEVGDYKYLRDRLNGY